jgi:tetratricopeptide (TPR) repeat protein
MKYWTKSHPRNAAQGWMSLTLARTLLEEQKREEAAEVFENALRNNVLREPQDVLLYADLLVQLNQPSRAVDLYRLALKSGPDSATAEWAKVQIVLILGADSRKEVRLNAMAPDEQFTDLLFHRAAGAMHIGLQAPMANEGE